MSRFIVLLAIAYALFPTKSNACSCFDTTPREAMEQADLVFAGTVTAVSAPYFDEMALLVDAKLTVQRAWKGEASRTMSITTPATGSVCGVNFQEGYDYLVYAYESEGGQQRYFTYTCLRTGLLSRAEEDLHFLGEGYPVDVEEPHASYPLELGQNYPNPFQGTTQITYTLDEAMAISLRVYDMLGRQVRPALTAQRSAGTHSERLNLRAMPPGAYVYEIQVRSHVLRRCMMLTR